MFLDKAPKVDLDQVTIELPEEEPSTESEADANQNLNDLLKAPADAAPSKP